MKKKKIKRYAIFILAVYTFIIYLYFTTIIIKHKM